MKRLQRLTAAAAAIALLLPLSLTAETRRRERTDLERLAADLERVLGRSVELTRRAPSAPPPATDAAADRLLEAMNRTRAARGLQPLRPNARLSLAARDRVDDMFAQRYFDHVAPDGTKPFTWAERRGYGYRTIGENLATGHPSPERVVDGWMRSPGHRANLLARDYDEVGIAIAPESPVRGYGGPLVVAMYGAR